MHLLNVFLTIVYVICCLFLGFVVLIQKGEGGGLGGAFGGGAVDVAFGAKADMTWKRATAVAATIFMCLAIFLGVLQQQLQQQSIAAQAAAAQSQKNAAKGAPGMKAGPTAPGKLVQHSGTHKPAKAPAKAPAKKPGK